MARVKGGVVSRKRRKKVLKQAKGYFGSKHALFRTAKEQVMNSLAYAYHDRRKRKTVFRKLWITRINAQARKYDLSYSQFMNGLSKAGIDINRKMLSELAINSPEIFEKFINLAKAALTGTTIDFSTVSEHVQEMTNDDEVIKDLDITELSNEEVIAEIDAEENKVAEADKS